MVGRKAAVGGRGGDGVFGSGRGGVIDRLGGVAGKGVVGYSVGVENNDNSSNAAAYGGVGSRGCEAVVGNTPVTDEGGQAG